MNTDTNVWHVYPLNDEAPHDTDNSTQTDEHFLLDGEIRYVVTSPCACNPQIEYQPEGGTVIIHNSYDMREIVEAANEIINPKTVYNDGN